MKRRKGRELSLKEKSHRKTVNKRDLRDATEESQ